MKQNGAKAIIQIHHGGVQSLLHESSNDDGTINDDVITYMAQRSSDVSLALILI